MYLWRRLSKAFPESSFKPIVFDVCDQPAVLRAVAVVRSKLQNQHLFGIVNNAGIGLCGPSALVPIEDVRQMLETNLVGPLIVSQAFIPLLGGEKSLQGMRELQFDIVVICALYLFWPLGSSLSQLITHMEWPYLELLMKVCGAGVPGRIVQVSSMAATLSVPWGGLYCASKSALEAMTASMRRELNIYGISTSIVRPGSVPTALQAKVYYIEFTMSRRFILLNTELQCQQRHYLAEDARIFLAAWSQNQCFLNVTWAFPVWLCSSKTWVMECNILALN